VSADDLLIAIPARRASTRLPDKLLLKETGKPVLQHTIERAREAAERSRSLGGPAVHVAVVCDDPELAEVARQSGVHAVLTGPCDSGTERIARALGALPVCSAVANLQADEPEMPVDWIAACLRASREERADVVTLAVPIDAGDPALNNPNAVKVVLDHQSYGMYFSRLPIPALREGGRPPRPRAFRHVGLYVYSTAFLQRYLTLPASDLEESECLEQLRFLQAQTRIKVLVRTEQMNVRGIDTIEDYRAFVARQAGQRQA